MSGRLGQWGRRACLSLHCQLSHGARPTDPPLILTQPVLTMSPLCGRHGVGSSPAGLTKALLPGFQPWPSSLLPSDFVQGPLLASVSPSVKWGEGLKKLR